jgi:peptidyl-prolyl cis-trans isomerase SurA
MTRVTLQRTLQHWLSKGGFCWWLVLWSAVYGVAQAAPQPMDRVLAVVNDGVVLESDLNQEMRNIENQYRAQGMPIPPREVLRRQVLDHLIMVELQVQRAEQGGIRISNDMLNEAVYTVAQRNQMDMSQFASALQQEGIDFAAFRERLRKQLLLEQLRQREVAARVKVTDEEVDNYLRQQGQQNQQPSEYHIRHILIGVSERASPAEIAQKNALAQRIRQELVKGGDFAQAAVRYSQGETALNGGDMEWRPLSEVPRLFAERLAGMRSGEISDVIRSPSGFHVFQLVEKRNAAESSTIMQVRLRQILVRTNEVTKAANAEGLLLHLRQRIQNGEPFGKMAKEYSDDKSTSANGGDMGWIAVNALPQVYLEHMSHLANEEVSEPFATPDGWVMIQVVGQRQMDNTQAVRRERARQALMRRKLEEDTELYLRRLRDEAYVEIKDPTLKS